MGALSNNEALSGAIGATVAEIIGEGFAHLNPEAFDPTNDDYDPSKRPDLTRNGTALAEISAATVATFLGQDPNTAAHTANNAVTENSFKVVIAIGKQLFKGAATTTKEVAKKGAKDTVKKAGKTAASSSTKKTGQTAGKAAKNQGQKPLLGKNPRVSKHRTSTDLGPKADRATAKSVFRNQTKGKKKLLMKDSPKNLFVAQKMVYS